MAVVAERTERERIEQLERENERLRQENERLRKLLEEALRKLKRQAAPFSRNRPKANPKQPGRKPGAEYGTRGARPAPPVVREQYTAALPEHCSCGGEICHDRTVEQYQEDILRQKIARLFEVQVGHCRRCGKRAQGRHALQTSDALGAAAVQIGPEAVVLAAHLNKAMGLSHEKVARALELGYGLEVERSTLCRALLRMGVRARPTYEQLLGVVRQSPVAWMDETGWRVAAALHWLWAAATRQVVAYVIAPGRGFAQASAILGEQFAGVLHHDGLRLYYGFPQAAHQSCLAHLIRRCREMLEASGTPHHAGFASQVGELLRAGIAVRQRYDSGQISLRAMRGIATKFENGPLDDLLLQSHRSPADQRLSNHLAHESPYLFTFLRNPAVEPTNNFAERLIRPAVVTRKSWGGNRTPNGARAQESLTSVLATARLQGQDSFRPLLALMRSPDPGIIEQLIPAAPDSS